jgi:hypothetical protein
MDELTANSFGPQCLGKPTLTALAPTLKLQAKSAKFLQSLAH